MPNYHLIDLFPQLSALAGPAMPDYRLTDLILIAIVFVLMPLQSLVSGRRHARTARSERNLVNRYLMTIVRAILLSAFILLSWHWLGRPYSTLGLDMPVSLAGQIGFGFDALITCYLGYLLLAKLPPEKRAAMQKELENARIMPRTGAEFALYPFMALVGSPMEELLFRGFLFWVFTPVAGLWGAVAISTAVFGLAHLYQGWSGVLRTGLIGLAFGIGFALTHSLWWLMLAHIMMNLQAMPLARKLKRLAAAPA